MQDQYWSCMKVESLEKEQYYLDNLKPEYNIAEIAGSTLGYKHTPESLTKMRDFVLSVEVLERKRKATVNAAFFYVNDDIIINIKNSKRFRTNRCTPPEIRNPRRLLLLEGQRGQGGLAQYQIINLCRSFGILIAPPPALLFLAPPASSKQAGGARTAPNQDLG